MATLDNHDPCSDWQLYPIERGSLQLVDSNIDRPRRLLVEESPRLFLDQVNRFKILRVLEASKGNDEIFEKVLKTKKLLRVVD